MRAFFARVLWEPFRRFARLSLVAGALLCSPFLGVSRADISDPQPPAGTGPLPDFQKGAKSGVLVTREYADKYRNLLPPEVAALLDSGQLSFEAALRPRGAILPVHGWSLKDGSGVSLGPSGSLSREPGALKSFLFEAPSVLQVEREPQAAAFSVLWNATSVMWGFPSFQQDLSMSMYRDGRGAARNIQLVIERMYPGALGVKIGTLPPLFRERLSVTAPQALTGLRWLTLRFEGPTDDYVWVSSPITGHARPLTGSNRGDPLFNGAISTDDLYVWSGKVEQVRPSSIRLIPQLVPVIDTNWQRIDAERESNGCQEAQSSTKSGERDLVFAPSANRADHAPWIPSNLLFVLRAVWKVDVATNDLFSLDARQSIYIDALTNAPVYRIVWDQDGRLRKTIIGIIGASSPGVRMPLWRGQVMQSPADGSQSVLLGQRFRVCDKEVEGYAVADLDPSLLAPTPNPSPVADSRSKGVRGNETR